MKPEDVDYQVEAWLQYTAKRGSRGLTFWMDSKGFTREERRQIMLALGDRMVG